MTKLTRLEVINWLRQEARKLTAVADSLEESMTPHYFGPDDSANGAAAPTVTPEMLRARLRKGSSRVPQLAKEFHTDQETLRRMIGNRNSGIVMEERGWLKLRDVNKADL
jgi:hypothetical protein